jgi:hypothetical protein
MLAKPMSKMESKFKMMQEGHKKKREFEYGQDVAYVQMEREEGRIVEGVPMGDITGAQFERQQKQQKLKEVLQMQREEKIYADVQSRQTGAAHSAEEKRRYDLAMAQLSAKGGTARGAAAEEQLIPLYEGDRRNEDARSSQAVSS